MSIRDDYRDSEIVGWMLEAYLAAVNSPDPSTQNGAVLVPQRSMLVRFEGWNMPVPGCDENRFLEDRNYKYKTVIHAETSVLDQAAFEGFPTEGSILVCSWAACTECAKRIIHCGVKALVRHAPRMKLDHHNKDWLASIEMADEWFANAGVEVLDLEGPVEEAPTIRHSGKRFRPDV